MTDPIVRSTFARLSALIESERESYPVHEIVAAYAEAHKGKPITKRDVAALEAANPGWRFSLHAGDSWAPGKELAFWKDNEWNTTRSELRISRGAGLSRWADADALKSDTNNARYFKFAQERNAERDALLSAETGKSEGLRKAAVLIDQLALLHQELKATIESYQLDDASYRIREILKEKTGEDIKLY